jgi:signal transduction histidine kinase/GAF domain-containing protein
MTTTPVENSTLQDLAAFREFHQILATALDLNILLPQMAAQITAMTGVGRVLIFVADDENLLLKFGAISSPLNDIGAGANLRNLTINTFSAESDPVLGAWLAGQPFTLNEEVVPANPALKWLIGALGVKSLYSVPAMVKNRLVGVLIIDRIDGEPQRLLNILSPAAAIMLDNARVHTAVVEKSAANMHESEILQRIDKELNDNIELNYVFNMTLDWALRFTTAQAASLSLYNQDTDELRMMAQYGYDIMDEQLVPRMQQSGIAHRVARSGRPENIPDVSMDKDFVRFASMTNSLICVPVIRDTQVIAVVTIESKRLNGFTDDHLQFVEKLAARAGVAIDNARLFAETKREREKLSHILNSIADAVVVIGWDGRLSMINPSAFAALRLYITENYIGQEFSDLFEHTPLTAMFGRAEISGETAVDEVNLNDRTFHITISPHENVGWLMVMHDITPFKEMDKLKNELIQTVSHDLKQPLAVMNGYTELLLLHRQFDATGINFMEMVRKSIANMRQLIDDLLDMAKIESGIRLNLQPIHVKGLISECLDLLQPSILNKHMQVTMPIADDVPPALADRARLQQILINLISNAVKYTPPEGKIKITAEKRDTMVRIAIQDNGLGISPEDQAHIFDRFYRVRRPETDSIEGTGLGLAIVKSLVETHNGRIGLESRLGEGSTFYVTFPLALTENNTSVTTS